jgi:hypothetical protein
MQLEPNQKLVWEAQEGSQRLAMSCPSNTILYHGTRGGGKTDVQIMRFRQTVGRGYGIFWRGLIIDTQLSSLDDIIGKTKKYFLQFNDGAKFLASKGEYKWVWKTGEELLLRAIRSMDDYDKLHGSEFPFIGVNEVSKQPTPVIVDLLSSLNRSSFVPEENPLSDGTILPEIPMCQFYTSNPSGVGRNWLKKRFIDASISGEILKTTVEILNPRTQEVEPITTTQCHIFSTWAENKKLSPKYIVDLYKIKDPAKRRAWLFGDWDAGVDGGMFDDVWDSFVHVVKPFNIPNAGTIDRCFDWGSSAPFSVGWYWTSDGSDIVLANGRLMSTVKGDVFRIGEWYGCDPDDTNKGLYMKNEMISKGIIERELKMGIYGRVRAGAADNAIWNIQSGISIAGDMLKPVRLDDGTIRQGVAWARSDKSAGSRVGGWIAVREFLSNSFKPPTGIREKAGLFVFNTCKDFIEIFPTLPRDSKNLDDLDTDSCDHIADELRYKILSTATGARFGKTKGA